MLSLPGNVSGVVVVAKKRALLGKLRDCIPRPADEFQPYSASEILRRDVIRPHNSAFNIELFT